MTRARRSPGRVGLGLLTLLLPAGAQEAAPEAEAWLLRGQDASGRAVESLVTLRARGAGGVELERTSATPGDAPRSDRGPAVREGEVWRASLSPGRQGLAGALGGAPAGGELRATYRLDGEAVWGEVRQDQGLLAEESGRRLPAPLPVERYALADPTSARDGDAPVDLAALNALPSALLLALRPDERAEALLVVPGYASERQGARRLHRCAQARARLAAELLRRGEGQVILATGGNVHPAGTAFNEAVELRRYLIEQLGVPPWRVAVDPYARHTTTNMRNAGRFALAHGLRRALVVTSLDQSFYLAGAALSTFHARCARTLGYRVGLFQARTHRTTRFAPSPDVFRRGDDPLDP